MNDYNNVNILSHSVKRQNVMLDSWKTQIFVAYKRHIYNIKTIKGWKYTYHANTSQNKTYKI